MADELIEATAGFFFEKDLSDADLEHFGKSWVLSLKYFKNGLGAISRLGVVLAIFAHETQSIPDKEILEAHTDTVACFTDPDCL